MPAYKRVKPAVGWARFLGGLLKNGLLKGGKIGFFIAKQIGHMVPEKWRDAWKQFFRGTRKVAVIGAGVLVVMILPVVIWQLRSPFSKVNAAWFDGAYGYRRKLTVSNSSGSGQTDFQVQITVDTATLISASKMLSSCNDIRITDSTGKILPLWIEPGTCNTSSTLIWTKIPSVPTTGADIYVYYGNATASSVSTTQGTFIRDMASAAVAWPLDETTTTQSYSRAVHPSLATGRNIVLNGTFDSSSNWTTNSGVTIASGVAHWDGSEGTGSSLTQTSPAVSGKAYQLTFTVSNYVSGEIQIKFVNNSGTFRTANGTYTQNLISDSTTVALRSDNGFVGDIDNVSVTEVNVPATPNVAATQLLTDGDMEASGTSAWTGELNGILSKEVTNPHSGSQLLRITRNGNNFAGASQSIAVAGNVYRVYGYARSDGNVAPEIRGPDVVNWTGTTSTNWQAFDLVFVAATSGKITFRMSGGSATQYVEFDDVTVALDTGIRSGDLFSTLDGNMEQVGTNYWTTSNDTFSKVSASPRTGQALRATRAGGNWDINSVGALLVIGKTYHFTGWVRSDGTSNINVYNSFTIQLIGSPTSWTAFDVTFVARNSALLFRATGGADGNYYDVDDLVLTETSPLVGLPTNGVTLGSSSGSPGHLSTAYNFDGTNDAVSLGTASLNSVFNQNEGTLVAWAKVSGSGVWTDGNARYIAKLYADGNDQIYIFKNSASNQMRFRYTAGGTQSEVIANSFSPTTWFQVVLTWSKSADQVSAYINGVQSGSTQTGLGTFVGGINSSVQTAIGTSNTSSDTTPWSGQINDVRLYSRALSAQEIADQYNASYDTQNYYTGNYTGHELIRKYNTGVTVGALASEETTPGPLLTWTMDEGSGTIVHGTSGSGNNGTLGGSTLPAWSAAANCVSSNCLYFDGSSSKVTGSKVATNLQTVGFWIRPTSTNTQGIWNLDGGTHKIGINSSGQITATGWTSPTYYINGNATTTPTLTANQWNHVEITTGTGFNTTSSFTLGTDGSSFVQGYLDEIKWYPYARTAAQVKADYAGGAASLGKVNQAANLPTGLVANWPLDDASGSSYNRVVNPAVATGRNIVLDGDMETSGTSYWAATNNANLSKQTTSPHGGSQLLRVAWVDTNVPSASQTILAIGREYRVRGYVRSDGTVIPRVVLGSGTVVFTGTTSTSWQEIDVTFINDTSTTIRLQSNINASGYTEWDDVALTELSIPASPNVVAPQLLVDGDMEASGTSAWGSSANATLSKQTTSPHGGTQLLRVATNNGTANAQAQQSVMTANIPYRVSGYLRSDGTTIPSVQVSGGGVVFTGSSGTTWQPFDAVFKPATAVLALRNTSSSGYVEFDDVVVSLETGMRPGELLQDGNMEQSGTSYWLSNNSATLSKQTSSPHGGTQVLRVAYNAVANPSAEQDILVTGKSYRVTGFTRSDGSIQPRVLTSAVTQFTGTTSTSWQAFDVTFVNTGDTRLLLRALASGTGYVEFDDVSVTEVSPMVGLPTNGVTLGASAGAGGHGTTAASFDGTNDFVNIYSGSLVSAMNPNEGTLLAWAKVSSSGVWSDGSFHLIVAMDVDGTSNRISIYKNTANNTMAALYAAGGTSSQVQSTTLNGTTNWFQVVLTWSKSSDQVKMYVNGNQVGSTLTGLGTWTGNISSNRTVIGSQTTSASSPWSGLINDVQLYNRPLTASEISNLYGANNPGSETAAGPVGYWKFDEKTGTSAADSSGNNFTATLTNGPTWTAGKYGNAVNYDGVNDYTSIADNALLSPGSGTGDYTVSTWFKTTANYSGGNGVIFENKGTVANNAIDILIGTTNQILCQYRDGSGNSLLMQTTGPTVNDGAWHHAECIKSGTTGYSYLDGVMIRTTTNSNIGTIDTTGRIKAIGSIDTSPGTAGNFTGAIDEVKIYNYARSPAQILEDMNGGQSGAASGANVGALPKPQGYWPFDEGQGTIADNVGLSGSSLNGTLTNMAAPATSTSGWNQTGKVNKAITFDGSNDYVDLGDLTTSEAASQLSWSFWVNPTTLATSKCIWCKLNNATTQTSWGIGTGPSTSSQIQVFIPTSTTDLSTYGLTPSGALANGTWSHVVVVFDGTGSANSDRLKVYVNGKLQTLTFTGTIPATTQATTSNARFGASSDGTVARLFTGVIDEPKFYNTALTAAQAQQDMNNSSSVNFSTTAATQASISGTDGAGSAPIAYWNFDEKTGTTANDISGNGNTGTLTNGPTWTSGKVGAAINFDGVDDRITAGVHSSLNFTKTTPFTLEAWFNYTGAGTDNAIIGTRSGATNSQWYVLKVVSGKLIFSLVGSSTLQTASNTSLTAGTWYHVVAIYDGVSTGTIYLNGKLDATQTTSMTTFDNAGGTFMIGAEQNAVRLWNGVLDDVKVYNYARTPAQIAYDYNRGGPVGYWQFDECNGTTANDASGNGNNGTITIGSGGSQASAGNCTTSSTAWGNGATGKYNASLNFDGTDDYVTTSSISPLVAAGQTYGEVSWSAWVFPTSSVTSKSIMEYANNLQIVTNSSGVPQCGVFISSSFSTTTATSTLPLNTWTHLVCTYSDSSARLRLYVNGRLEGNSNRSGTMTATSSILYVGESSAGTQRYSGQIDDLRLYNYTLSVTQIRQLFNQASSVRYGPTSGSP